MTTSKYTDRPARIFLSYSRDDHKSVSEIRDLLQDFEIEVWFDTDDLVPGQEWEDEISLALKDSDLILVCVAARGIDPNSFFMKEVVLAKEIAEESDGAVTIAPLRLEATSLPQVLQNLQWLDFFKANGPDVLLDLVRRVAKAQNRHPVADTPHKALKMPAESWDAEIHRGDKKLGLQGKRQSILFVQTNKARVLNTKGRVKAGVRPLIWGDPVRLEQQKGDRAKVRARGGLHEIKMADIGPNRPLEIDFLELGGGCATRIRTPDGRYIIFNVGIGDYLRRYLEWRHDAPIKPVYVDAVVLSHGFQDHTEGLGPILDSAAFRIGTLYHNGVLAPLDERPQGLRFVRDEDDLEACLKRHRHTRFASLLRRASQTQEVGKVRMIGASEKFLPGFGPGDSDVIVRVLHPNDSSAEVPLSRSRSDIVRSNAVVLSVEFGHLRVLLRGEVGQLGEQRLMTAHDRSDKLRADVAKLCYHNTQFFEPGFLDRVAPQGIVAALGASQELLDDAPGVPEARVAPEALFVSGAQNLALSTPPMLEGLRRMLEIYEARCKGLPSATLPKSARGRYQKALRRFGTYLDYHHVVRLRSDGRRALLARRRRRGNTWKLALFESDGGIMRYCP